MGNVGVYNTDICVTSMKPACTEHWPESYRVAIYYRKQRKQQRIL